jgi:hypothetical protein
MTSKLDPLIGLKGEARLRYLDASFEVIAAGDFVRCAVTGDVIPVAELKYWNVERQEPYKDAAASLRRHLQFRPAAQT